MADSSLVTKFIQADASNYTQGRAAYSPIKTITIHHCASILTIEALGTLWQRPARNGSSHYGVYENDIGQYVAESDIAWTDGNWTSNCQSVTIETSNCGGAPDWPVSDVTLATLIRLIADIAKRNNLVPLVKGGNLVWHQLVSDAYTACPGPYLLARMQYIADAANAMLAPAPDPTLTLEPVEGKEMRTLTGSCEIFQELSVDKPVGKLPAHTVYPVLAMAQADTTLAGLSGPWVQVRTAVGEAYYALALTDRAEITDIAPEAPESPAEPPEEPAEETPAPEPDKPVEEVPAPEPEPEPVTTPPQPWWVLIIQAIAKLLGGGAR